MHAFEVIRDVLESSKPILRTFFMTNMTHRYKLPNHVFLLDNQVVTGDVAKFLANWRQEQMSLIQEEIRKLHTLEWLLHKFEKPEFFNQIFPAP